VEELNSRNKEMEEELHVMGEQLRQATFGNESSKKETQGSKPVNKQGSRYTFSAS